MKKLENLKTKNFYEYISLLFIFVSGTIYFTYEKQIILCLVYYVIFLILFLFLCNWKIFYKFSLICVIFLIWSFIFKVIKWEKFQIKDLINLIPNKFNLRWITLEYLKQQKNQQISMIIMLMVFNEKVSLTNDFYHQLVNLGIVHLFVVSGLHLNLIYYGIRKILKKHHKISKIFAILIICFYGYLLNFSYGVLRVLFTIICSLFLQKRKYTSNNDFLINTSCSGMMILIINPWAIFNLSFQLTYLACMGLSFFNDVFGLSKWISGFIGSFVINLLLGPIILKLNNKISLLTIFNSWILNPIIIFYYIVSIFIFPCPFIWFLFNFLYESLIWLLYVLNTFQFFFYLNIYKINEWIVFFYYEIFIILLFSLLKIKYKS